MPKLSTFFAALSAFFKDRLQSVRGHTDNSQERLNAGPSTQIAPYEEPDHHEHNQGPATQLHLLSLLGLQHLCRRRQSASWPDSKLSRLKEELGNLYLWGEAFENGKLDKALERNEGLRDTVLELLCAIGNTIIRGKS